LTSVGQLWLNGVEIDWDAFREGQKRHRLPLPSYPFERTRYWLDIDGSNLNGTLVDGVVLRSASSPRPELQGDDSSASKSHRKPGLPPYKSPSNPTEKSLVSLWQQLFGFDKIGINDDFFTLGGDSLKAINFVSNIRKQFNVEIPLTEFFNRPTIAELSRYVDKTTDVDQKQVYAPIGVAGEKDHYVLSSAQKRIYILMEVNPRSISYNIPLVVALDGDINKEKVQEVFQELVVRHDTLRTSFTTIDENPFQVVLPEVEFVTRYMELEDGEDVQSRMLEITEEFVAPFDLSQAPLLRVLLVKTQDRKYILVVDMHHIISDGFTVQILKNEFWKLYTGEQLEPLRLQYRDFSEWQSSSEGKEYIKRQESFWLKEFDGEIPVLNIPLDYPRPEIKSFDGQNIDFEIGKEKARQVKELASRENATVYTLMLAVYYILLAKLGNSEDVIIGSAIQGRSHPDLRKIVGMFVNLMALRNFPENKKTFRTFLQEVRGRVLKAFMNQDYPFEDLIEAVGIDRVPGRNPLLDIGFQLQEDNAVEDRENNDGIKPPSEVKYYENKVAKMDMIFYGEYSPDKIKFTVEYATTLFKEQTIHSYFGYYNEILSTILEDPDVEIGNIEVISREKSQEFISGLKDKNEELCVEFQF
jgi:acyl carrier protein